MFRGPIFPSHCMFYPCDSLWQGDPMRLAQKIFMKVEKWGRNITVIQFVCLLSTLICNTIIAGLFICSSYHYEACCTLLYVTSVRNDVGLLCRKISTGCTCVLKEQMCPAELFYLTNKFCSYNLSIIYINAECSIPVSCTSTGCSQGILFCWRNAIVTD